jgi:hypothetical protein
MLIQFYCVTVYYTTLYVHYGMCQFLHASSTHKSKYYEQFTGLHLVIFWKTTGVTENKS